MSDLAEGDGFTTLEDVFTSRDFGRNGSAAAAVAPIAKAAPRTRPGRLITNRVIAVASASAAVLSVVATLVANGGGQSLSPVISAQGPSHTPDFLTPVPGGSSGLGATGNTGAGAGGAGAGAAGAPAGGAAAGNGAAGAPSGTVVALGPGAGSASLTSFTVSHPAPAPAPTTTTTPPPVISSGPVGHTDNGVGNSGQNHGNGSSGSNGNGNGGTAVVISSVATPTTGNGNGHGKG
jgi:hypothetical protein